jgi:hypothetical protein
MVRLKATSRGRGTMYEMVRLAGVSAVLAAVFVLATGERSMQPGPELRPSLVVVFGESQPGVNVAAAPSRTDTQSDIILK